MPIVSGDIDFRLSGGASNSDPTASLGGIMSTTTDVDGATLFDTVVSADATAGETNYRCIYILNSHGSLSLTSAVVWIQANTPSATTAIAIALAGEGVNATAETVVNEDTAPSGESFVAAANEGAGLSLGTIAAGQRYGLWIRRVVDAGTAAVADTFTIRVKGDTAA